LAVKRNERRTVRGKTIEFKHLGRQRVEFATAKHDAKLRQELRRSCSKSRYHTGKARENSRRNLVCHLMPTEVKSFQELIDKIINVIVSKIEAFEKAHVHSSMITETVKKAVKKAKKPSRKSSDGFSMKRYRYEPLQV